MDILKLNECRRKLLIVAITILLLLAKHVDSNQLVEFQQFSVNVSFSPQNLTELFWKDQHSIILTYTCFSNEINRGNVTKNDVPKLDIKIISKDEFIADGSPTNLIFDCSGYEKEIISNELSFSIRGNFLGKTALDFYFTNISESTYIIRDANSNITDKYKFAEYDVVVINEETVIYTTFIVVVAILVIILNFGFGCKINLEDVKQILRRPFSPILGLFCQIIIMPLLGIAITKIFRMEAVLGFGLFVVACAPGGSGSNVWTFLLNGDLDLSMTMTLFSKTLALGTMPGWLFALSRLYVADTENIKISIPYTNLITGLLSIALPLLFGILLNKWKPNLAKKVTKFLKPVSVLFILWVLIVGSITNLYVYTIMSNTWYTIPAGCLLSYLGMVIGFTVAKVLRQPLNRVIAISIETGIQDSGIAILLFLSSFEKPLGSIASTMAIVVAAFTPIPPLIAVICLSIYKYCWKGGKCISCGGPEQVEKPVPMDDHDSVNIENSTEHSTNDTRMQVADHDNFNDGAPVNDTLPATFDSSRL